MSKNSNQEKWRNTRLYQILETALLTQALKEYRKEYYNKNGIRPSIALEDKFIETQASSIQDKAFEVITESLNL